MDDKEILGSYVYRPDGPKFKHGLSGFGPYGSRFNEGKLDSNRIDQLGYELGLGLGLNQSISSQPIDLNSLWIMGLIWIMNPQLR